MIDFDVLSKTFMLWDNGDISADKHLYLTKEEVITLDGAVRENVKQAMMFTCYYRMAQKQVVIQ